MNNSSNSFNICPRCGNSNALSARFCSRCGGQLKVPETPVVCHKCHTHNSPMSNFCRNCGTLLEGNSDTKICPRCNREVSGDKTVCECGYSFVTYQQANPDKATKAPKAQKQSKPDKDKTQKAKSEKVYSKKGGRGWAIAGIILVLLFAYYIVAPFHLYDGNGDVSTTLRPEFLVNFDKGFIFLQDDLSTASYGCNFVVDLIALIKAVAGGASFGELMGSLSIGYIMILVLSIIFILTALVHLVVCIIRSITAKRSKKMNLYFLIMAIISTLVVGLMTLFSLVQMPEGTMQKIASWFALSEGMTLGYAVWAIPLYFWFFYLYSLGAKAKKLKENA